MPETNRVITLSAIGLDEPGLISAITKKILEIMGARIQVKSRLGKGSEFSFKLQFQQTEGKKVDASEITEQKTNRKTLNGIKVLLFILSSLKLQ